MVGGGKRAESIIDSAWRCALMPFRLSGADTRARCSWEYMQNRLWMVRLVSSLHTLPHSQPCPLSPAAYAQDILNSLSGAQKISAYVRSGSHRTCLITHSVSLWPTSDLMYVRWPFRGDGTHHAISLPLISRCWTSYTNGKFLPPLLDVQAFSSSNTPIADAPHNGTNPSSLY